MGRAAHIRRVSIWLTIAVLLNVFFWAGSRKMYAEWAGVPPVPSKRGAVVMALGDSQFAYRNGTMTLQTLGDEGGRSVPLKSYDYSKLKDWFWLLHDLDPASEHLPAIVAYYYGAVRDPARVAVIVDYLAHVGQNPAGEKWRWLGQAAFLARHRLKDLDLALDIAYTLAKMQPLSGDLPGWARQFPAFILEAQGEKEAAKEMMVSLIRESNLPWQEMNFMIDMLKTRLGMPAPEVESLVQEWKDRQSLAQP